ncbi:MAG: hypothetical protein RTV72_13475 [Candidatus Thorarchaeota archaeon]
MSSEDDNVRTDEYWMGVRDALRMVDSFNKWSIRNPGRAKDLEDFIHDGLIAAAKRCESCLRDKLGLSFIEGQDEETIDFDLEPEETIEAPSFEMPTEHVEVETETASLEDSDESSASLDAVERIEDESMDDLSIEGPPREFSTDFELVEPTPMTVDEATSSDPVEAYEPDSEPEPEPEPEPESESEPEEEEMDDKPSFTWSEYEAAVTPSSEPEPLDPEVDIVISEDEETTIDEEIETPPEEPLEPPEPPKVWSPYDEPSIPEDEESEDEKEDETDETEPLEEGEDEPVISEPPAPPPPPESEEDEEERKRRARRLFFGA